MAFAAAQTEDGYLPLDRTVHPQATNVSPAQERSARSRSSHPPSTASIRRRLAQYKLMVDTEDMPDMVVGLGNTSMQPCSISDVAYFCMCMPACHRTSDTNGQTNRRVVVNRRCVPTQQPSFTSHRQRRCSVGPLKEADSESEPVGQCCPTLGYLLWHLRSRMSYDKGAATDISG